MRPFLPSSSLLKALKVSLKWLPDVCDQDVCDPDVCDPDVCDLDVCDHLFVTKTFVTRTFVTILKTDVCDQELKFWNNLLYICIIHIFKDNGHVYRSVFFIRIWISGFLGAKVSSPRCRSTLSPGTPWPSSRKKLILVLGIMKQCTCIKANFSMSIWMW